MDRTTGSPDTSRRETARTGLGPSPRVVNVREEPEGGPPERQMGGVRTPRGRQLGQSMGLGPRVNGSGEEPRGGRHIGEAKVGGCAPRGRRAKDKHGDKSIAPPAGKEEPKGVARRRCSSQLDTPRGRRTRQASSSFSLPSESHGGLTRREVDANSSGTPKGRRKGTREGLDLEAVRPRDRERGMPAASAHQERGELGKSGAQAHRILSDVGGAREPRGARLDARDGNENTGRQNGS